MIQGRHCFLGPELGLGHQVFDVQLVDLCCKDKVIDREATCQRPQEELCVSGTRQAGAERGCGAQGSPGKSCLLQWLLQESRAMRQVKIFIHLLLLTVTHPVQQCEAQQSRCGSLRLVEFGVAAAPCSRRILSSLSKSSQLPHPALSTAPAVTDLRQGKVRGANPQPARRQHRGLHKRGRTGGCREQVVWRSDVPRTSAAPCLLRPSHGHPQVAMGRNRGLAARSPTYPLQELAGFPFFKCRSICSQGLARPRGQSSHVTESTE